MTFEELMKDPLHKAAWERPSQTPMFDQGEWMDRKEREAQEEKLKQSEAIGTPVAVF